MRTSPFAIGYWLSAIGYRLFSQTCNLQPATCNAPPAVADPLFCGGFSGFDSSCASGRLHAQPEEEKLAAFFKSYLDQRFALRPVEATQLGDHRFDSQLETSRRKPAQSGLPRPAKRSGAAKRVNHEKLSRRQIDFEMLQHYLKFQEWLTVNLHPFEQDQGAITTSSVTAFTCF